MAVDGDIMQLTTVSKLYEQLCLNVYFYRITDGPSATWYTGLFTDFQSVVLTPVRAIQQAGVIYSLLQVRNLFNPAEVYEQTISLAGTRTAGTGDAPGSWVAHVFKLQRANALVRNGRKSFAGVLEQDQSGNTSLLPSSVYNPVQTALAAVLSPGAGVDVFTPVIVGRVGEGVGPGGGFASYRLPTSQAEMGANWAQVQSAQYRGISSMNSRKPGYGA